MKQRGRHAQPQIGTNTIYRTGVIFWEWIDGRGRGVISQHRLEDAQRAKLEEKLDRIEELESLDSPEAGGYLYPFSKELKKLKIRGNVALRPILVRGPFDRQHEITFLLVATEKDRKLSPEKRRAESESRKRLQEILDDRSRRREYERD